MKPIKIVFLILFLCVVSQLTVLGQGVGINLTGAPANSKSMLDVDATGKGMLIPRMAWANRPISLTASEAGLLIYSTDGDGTSGAGFYCYTGSTWVALLNSNSNVAGDNMGNCIATANIDLNTFNITGTGSININGKITSNGIQELSDIRYKKNIKPLKNVLSKVLSVQGVSYDWKKDEFPEKAFADKTEIGFIAQELEKYFPNLVQTDSNGYKTVQYSHMVPVLLEAIKEQQKLIQNLQGSVSDLIQAMSKLDPGFSSSKVTAEVVKNK